MGENGIFVLVKLVVMDLLASKVSYLIDTLGRRCIEIHRVGRRGKLGNGWDGTDVAQVEQSLRECQGGVDRSRDVLGNDRQTGGFVGETFSETADQDRLLGQLGTVLDHAVDREGVGAVHLSRDVERGHVQRGGNLLDLGLNRSIHTLEGRVRRQRHNVNHGEIAQDTGDSVGGEHGIGLESLLNGGHVLQHGCVPVVEGLSNQSVTSGDRGVEREDISIESVDSNGEVSGHVVHDCAGGLNSANQAYGADECDNKVFHRIDMGTVAGKNRLMNVKRIWTVFIQHNFDTPINESHCFFLFKNSSVFFCNRKCFSAFDIKI